MAYISCVWIHVHAIRHAQRLQVVEHRARQGLFHPSSPSSNHHLDRVNDDVVEFVFIGIIGESCANGKEVAITGLTTLGMESTGGRITTAEKLDPANVLQEYPRPQLKRESFFCLNGLWRFAVNGEEKGDILVPYPPEAPLSGVDAPEVGDQLTYEREFTLPEGFRKDRVILHFGAVDQNARVFLNGVPVAEHEGGYLPFSAEITPYLKKGENLLSVEVTDPLDPDLPYGKQSRKPGGMWYTPVSGIWQTVWLESVPEEYVKAIDFTIEENTVTIAVDGVEAITITADTKSARIRIQGGEDKKKLILSCDGFAEEYRFEGEEILLQIPNGKLWTPETPHLYRITVFSGKDRVESYFALREISVEKRGGIPLICLNGNPYHFHGVLDQGYFSDGIFLPAEAEEYERDILRMKGLGFNLLRKHIFKFNLDARNAVIVKPSFIVGMTSSLFL